MQRNAAGQLLGEASRLLAAGQAEAALRLLTTVPAASPWQAQVLHLQGLARGQLGDAGGSLALLLDAARAGDASPALAVNIAVAARAGKRIDGNACACILQVLQRIAAPVQLVASARQVLQALSFVAGNDFDRNALLFRELVLPLLALYCARDLADAALELENQVYTAHVKQRETEEHFRACMGAMAPILGSAGARWGSRLPPLPAPAAGARPCMGFFLHNATTLAHVEIMLNTLRGYRALPVQDIDYRVYCFGGNSPELEQALAALAVPLVMLDRAYPETAGKPWARLLRLRERLAQDRVGGIAWVSLATMMSVAFAARIAPVQAWWAMKYHSLDLPGIDGYVTGGSISRYRTINDRQWRAGSLGVDDWYDATLETAAAELRRELGPRVVAGTLAREEKMADPVFLDTVCTLLRGHPDLLFLWAGRTESPVVTAAFRDAGVLAQTRFIGWVNTRLYAQVLDIFLDTFPYPCGFTLFQAMAAGKPAVISTTDESARSGIWAFIQPLLAGIDGTPREQAELRAMIGPDQRPHIAFARDPGHYLACASALVEDPALRAEAGPAARALMQRYFSDSRVMGRSFSDHFRELLQPRGQAPTPQETT